MTDFTQVKLGKQPADETKPKLKLADFLTEAATPPPTPKRDWMSGVAVWPMHLNDSIGDCTIAAQSHALLALSHYGQGQDVQVTDDQVLKAYEDVSGYNPATGQNDNGAMIQDALNHWRKTGLGGNKITAFAQVNIKNATEVETAVGLFGTVILGISLPITAQNQISSGAPWDYVGTDSNSQPGSWGGHCVSSGAYDTGVGTSRVVTWGQTQDMTAAFWSHYVDEAWIVITPEWINAQNTNPEGINLTALGEAFTALTGQPNPFPAPTPVTPPTPAPTPDPVPTPVPVTPPPPVDVVTESPVEVQADTDLATAAHAWLSHSHVGMNKRFGVALKAWLAARNK